MSHSLLQKPQWSHHSPHFSELNNHKNCCLYDLITTHVYTSCYATQFLSSAFKYSETNTIHRHKHHRCFPHVCKEISLTWSVRSARSTLFLFCRREYSACSTVKPQSTICWTLWSNSCKKKTKSHARNEKVQAIIKLAENPNVEEHNFHAPSRKLNTLSSVMWCHVSYLLSGLFSDNVNIWNSITLNSRVWKQLTTALSCL